jgi:hypothetical protein
MRTPLMTTGNGADLSLVFRIGMNGIAICPHDLPGRACFSQAYWSKQEASISTVG